MQQQLLPHLFRTEYSRIVSVLYTRFGLNQMEIAEDLTADTFMAAAQAWGLNGLPANPVAWLYAVAKNKAKNHLRRSSVFEKRIVPGLVQEDVVSNEPDIDLSPQNIGDSQLQMMFAICNPSIPAEAQVGLALRILCGFGIGEIAAAFFTNKETIGKRLYRAKQKLRAQNTSIAMPPPAGVVERLENVLTTIYLLFSEGYYSVTRERTINKELCLEAITLCHLLIDNKLTDQPRVNALLALMYFHTSRFDARLGKNGNLVLYEEQDTSRWNYAYIAKGSYYLTKASTGSCLSKYHLQAAIAYWNTQQADTPEKWENILQLYDRLLLLDYSPLAALNRNYALFKIKGRQIAIAETEGLELQNNHFYFMLLGELYFTVDNPLSLQHLQQALALAVTAADKQTIQNKIDELHK